MSLTYNSWGHNPKDLTLLGEQLLQGKRCLHGSSFPGCNNTAAQLSNIHLSLSNLTVLAKSSI